MPFSAIELFVNLLFLPLWVCVWIRNEIDFNVNPYGAALIGVSRPFLSFVGPVFGRLPRWLVALAALGMCLLVRALVYAALLGEGLGRLWCLRVGFEAFRMAGGGLIRYLACSVLSFALFLFSLWGLFLVFAGLAGRRQYGEAWVFLRRVCRPLSKLAWTPAAVVLVVVGALIAALLDLLGEPALAEPVVDVGRVSVRSGGLNLGAYVLLSLSSWANVLLILRGILIVLIIGSLVGAFTGSHGMVAVCREWLELVLYPLRRFRLQLGIIDLAPLVALVFVNLSYALLNYVLWHGYLAVL